MRYPSTISYLPTALEKDHAEWSCIKIKNQYNMLARLLGRLKSMALFLRVKNSKIVHFTRYDRPIRKSDMIMG